MLYMLYLVAHVLLRKPRALSAFDCITVAVILYNIVVPVPYPPVQVPVVVRLLFLSHSYLRCRDVHFHPCQLLHGHLHGPRSLPQG